MRYPLVFVSWGGLEEWKKEKFCEVIVLPKCWWDFWKSFTHRNPSSKTMLNSLKLHEACMCCLFVVFPKAKRNQLTTFLSLWRNNECMASVALFYLGFLLVLPDTKKDIFLVWRGRFVRRRCEKWKHVCFDSFEDFLFFILCFSGNWWY